MTLLACGEKVVPVVDASGAQLPAWPRFMTGKPLPQVTPETDSRTAWAAERADNKVCRSQLVRGKGWYEDLARDLAGKPEVKK